MASQVAVNPVILGCMALLLCGCPSAEPQYLACSVVENRSIVHEGPGIDPIFEIELLQSDTIALEVSKRIVAHEIEFLDSFSLLEIQEAFIQARHVKRLENGQIELGVKHTDAELAVEVANLFAKVIHKHWFRLEAGGMSEVHSLQIRLDQQLKFIEEIEVSLRDYLEERNAAGKAPGVPKERLDNRMPTEYFEILKNLEAQKKFKEALSSRLEEAKAKEERRRRIYSIVKIDSIDTVELISK